MNPFELFPLTNQHTDSRHDGLSADLGIAAYKAVEAIEAAWNWIDRQYRRRGSIRELSELNDHMLKDIGLRRSEIRGVVEAMLDAPAVRPVASWPVVKAGPAAPPEIPAAANDNRVVFAASNCS